MSNAELCKSLSRLTATDTPSNPAACAYALVDLADKLRQARDAAPAYMWDYFEDRAIEAENFASMFARQARL